MEAGFSLGSNDGDRMRLMSEAKRRILALPGVQEAGTSPLYETEPVGVAPEFAHLKFLNAVLIVTSEFTAMEWLDHLHRIERELGRVRNGDRNAPRPIDVDIIYAGDARIDSGGVVVPHPRWTQRRFVVQPLADVRPDLSLPGAGHTVREILATLKGEAVTRLDDPW